MDPESVGRSAVFINSDTAVLSNVSKRAARSHAAAWSRERQKVKKANLNSKEDKRSLRWRSSKSDESTVFDPAEPTLSQSPSIITPTGKASLNTLMDMDLLNPFDTTVLPLSRKMSGLLRDCTFFTGQRSYPLKTLTDAFNDWTLPLMLQDPILLNAAMCMASAELEIRDSTKTDRSSSAHSAIDLADRCTTGSDYTYFKFQAIKQLSLALCSSKTGKPSVPNICAIIFLLRAEWHYGNHQDIRAHLSGLTQAIEAAGGLSVFPLPVVLTIMSVVYVCSAMVRTRPPFRPPMLSIHRVSQSTRDAIDQCPDHPLNQMATGFCAPANRELLNPAIMRTIASIRTYLQFSKLSCTGAIRPSPEEFEFFYMRQSCVEYDLLALPFDETLFTITPLQNVVRLTLFIFGFATYTRFEPSSAYTHAIVAQLKESLELVDFLTLWTSDLLMWTLFFAALISSHTKERQWFITHLARNISQLDLKSADDMQNVLLRFFYIAAFSRDSLLDIWEDVSLVGRTNPRTVDLQISKMEYT